MEARARAALDLARLDRGCAIITAPIDGVVGNRQVQTGDYVQAGTRLLTLVPAQAVYVIANFKETQTRNMLVGQPAHISVDALGGELPVKQGWFNLFVDADEDGEERKLMRYRLWIEDGEGHPITLNGFKEVQNDPGFDVWSDTTTLFAHILAGHVPPGEVTDVSDAGEEIVATGILHVLPADFAVPDPSVPNSDEDPLDEGEAPEFHTDYLAADEPGR